MSYFFPKELVVVKKSKNPALLSKACRRVKLWGGGAVRIELKKTIFGEKKKRALANGRVCSVSSAL